MALKRPQGGQIVLITYVAGLRHYNYFGLTAKKLSTHTLTLKAEPLNPHDSTAVSVWLDDLQIGYIPRQSNKEAFKLLQAGEDLRVQLVTDRPTHPGPNGEPALVEIRVLKAPSPTVDEQRGIAVSPCSEDAAALEVLAGLPVNTRLQMGTTQFRSSVDVIYKGKRLGWFRKADLVTWAAEAIHYGHDIYAYSSQKSTIMLRSEPLQHEAPDLNDVWASGIRTGRTSTTQPNTQPNTQTTKEENTMTISNLITNAIETNRTAAAQAGYLEAGRIANNQLVKVAGKSLPLMARGYADTALGRLLIANAATVAAAQLRPNDPTLRKLTQAMTVAAYQEVIQSVDIEGMINNLLSSSEIQKAISKLPKDDDNGAKA